VCSLSCRPDDVILDPFSQGILDTLRGDEDLVEAVVFNENCTWTLIAEVAKNEKREEANRETAAGAELIDLSDSE